jgi:hypothetical protein
VRVTAALLAVGLAVIVSVAAYAVLTPFSGVPVPAACPGGTAGPQPHRVAVPGHGEATVIAGDRDASVVVVAAPDGRTAGGSVHLVAGGDTVFSLPLASRAVAAGVGDGLAFVFDDKIGYVLAAATGEPVARLLTVDNYRGLYIADGLEHIQTSLDIAILGAADRPLAVRSLPFGAIVDGCLVASAVGS